MEKKDTEKLKEHSPQTNVKRDFFAVSEAKPKNKSLRLRKRNLAFIAVVIVLALTIPLIFATAANTNEVAKIEEIKIQAANAAPAVTPEPAILPATTYGNLTWDLTDDAVQPSASPLASPAPTPTPWAEPTVSAGAPAAYRAIAPGTNDPFVAVIQQRLMDLQYMGQDDPTTLYGPVTKQAIEYFQRKNGLPQDGMAGVETQTLLFSENAKYYTVSEGDSGPDVQTIQERLAELGYSVGSTGYFGTDTTKIVKYFQRMNELTADGNVGSNTREVLFSQNAETSQEYTEAKEAEPDKTDGNDSGSSSPSPQPSSSPSPKPSSSPVPAPQPSSSPAPAPQPSSAPKPPADTSKVEAFINAALAQVGKPYVLGGKGPDVFDCSGFVYYALKSSGNAIPYMTSYGWANADQYTKITNMKDLKRGDVVTETGHVGIYLGNGEIVNASSSNGKVIISKDIFNSSYWTGKWILARRLF